MLALISLLTSPAFAQDDPKAVAARYAPVIYQEFSIYTQDQGDPDRAYDQLRRVDYDGDWNPLNNLDNHGNEAADNRGYVYFDVKSDFLEKCCVRTWTLSELQRVIDNQGSVHEEVFRPFFVHVLEQTIKAFTSPAVDAAES